MGRFGAANPALSFQLSRFNGVADLAEGLFGIDHANHIFIKILELFKKLKKKKHENISLKLVLKENHVFAKTIFS